MEPIRRVKKGVQLSPFPDAVVAPATIVLRFILHYNVNTLKIILVIIAHL